jgi:hypothetical protein
LVHFSHFGILHQEKSGSPGLGNVVTAFLLKTKAGMQILSDEARMLANLTADVE